MIPEPLFTPLTLLLLFYVFWMGGWVFIVQGLRAVNGPGLLPWLATAAAALFGVWSGLTMTALFAARMFLNAPAGFGDTAMMMAVVTLAVAVLVIADAPSALRRAAKAAGAHDTGKPGCLSALWWFFVPAIVTAGILILWR